MNDVTSETLRGVEMPSEQIAAQRAKVLVTDARGRIIAVHKLTALNYYQLTKALGDAANVAVTMDLAVTAAAVSRIDTTDFAFPRTETDITFLLQMLDFDGLKAAGEGLKQLHTKDIHGDGAEVAKNLAGNPPLS